MDLRDIQALTACLAFWLVMTIMLFWDVSGMLAIFSGKIHASDQHWPNLLVRNKIKQASKHAVGLAIAVLPAHLAIVSDGYRTDGFAIGIDEKWLFAILLTYFTSASWLYGTGYTGNMRTAYRAVSIFLHRFLWHANTSIAQVYATLKTLQGYLGYTLRHTYFKFRGRHLGFHTSNLVL